MQRLGASANAWQGETNAWGFSVASLEQFLRDVGGRLVVDDPVAVGVGEKQEPGFFGSISRWYRTIRLSICLRHGVLVAYWRPAASPPCWTVPCGSRLSTEQRIVNELFSFFAPAAPGLHCWC